jgi:hypothetical protein
MSQPEQTQPAPLPPDVRYEYAGNCWWCGNPADSREHKYKRSDLAREFGAGPWEQNAALVRGVAGGDRLHPVRGPHAAALKFDRSLCQDCNNRRSQPFDYAYDILANYLSQHEALVIERGWLKLSDLFGAGWRTSRDDVMRYYVKHIGCRLAEGGAKVPRTFIEFLDGHAPNPLGLTLTVEIRLDIVEMERHLREAHGVTGGSVRLGDLEGTYSRRRREITGLWSHLGVGPLRADYSDRFDGRGYRSNLRRNKARIRGNYNIPLDSGCDPRTVPVPAGELRSRPRSGVGRVAAVGHRWRPTDRAGPVHGPRPAGPGQYAGGVRAGRDRHAASGSGLIRVRVAGDRLRWHGVRPGRRRRYSVRVRHAERRPVSPGPAGDRRNTS